jgi:uncharacterized membrane protein YtjA (UPF0391 family)
MFQYALAAFAALAWALGFNGVAGAAAWLSNVIFLVTLVMTLIAVPLAVVLARRQVAIRPVRRSHGFM